MRAWRLAIWGLLEDVSADGGMGIKWECTQRIFFGFRHLRHG
jgi:hypothetical protein